MRWESIMELMGLAKVVEELTAMENLQNADNTKKILIQLSDGTVFECIDPEIVKKIYQSIKSLNMSTKYDYKSIDALRYFHKTNLQLIDCNERKEFSEEFKKTTPVLTIAQIIDPETCCVTELGAKLIRGMKCDEENVASKCRNESNESTESDKNVEKPEKKTRAKVSAKEKAMASVHA